MPACAILAVSLVAAINLAIPKLSASSLHPSATQLLWIVDIYVLVFGCLLIPAGALGDRYGRKGALLTGLAIVAAGCLLTAAAPGVPLLLCGRALTGVGAALVMPATLSLMMQVTAPDQRSHAVATWTAATGIAGIAGNVGGGLILQYLPWQGLFLAVAPLAVILAVLAAALTPRGHRHPADLDMRGSALLVAAIAALMYAIIEGPSLGWTSAAVLGVLALSAVLLAVFTLYAMRAAHPLLDPRVFRIPPLRAGSLGVGLTFFGLFALFFVNAQYLQYAKGFSPLVTGLAIGPLSVGMMLISRRSIGWAARLGTRRVVGAGLLGLAAGLALLSLADASTPYLVYACFLVVMSAGMGLCVPSLSTAVMTSLPRSRAGMGSGLNGATREIGSALGVAVFGTILTSRFVSSLHGSTVIGAAHVHSAAAALATAGPTGRAQVVTAFTDAMSVGYRVTGAIVLVLTPVILHWLKPAPVR
jgi:predicted MFS family arabinose efflux permease